MNLEDFAVELAQRPNVDKRTPASEWQGAVKGLTRSQALAVLGSFAGDGIKPADFAKARARMYPRAVCEFCADTGQVWVEDRDEWQPCVCPEAETRLRAAPGGVVNPRHRISDYHRRIGLEALRSLGYARNVPARVLDELGLEDQGAA